MEQHFPSFEKGIVKRSVGHSKRKSVSLIFRRFFFSLGYLNLYELLKLLFLGKKFLFPSAMILPVL